MNAEARDLRAEAWQILADAEPGDDPAVLAWAAGAARFTHVMHLCYVWDGGRLGDRMTQEGGTLGTGRHRYYGGDRHGLHLGSTPLVYRRDAALTVTWGPVEALMRKAPQRLRRQADELMAERRTLTGRLDMLHTRRMCGGDVTDAEAEAGELWQSVEARCDVLGANIWQHLRPAAQQLTLLSLLG